MKAHRIVAPAQPAELCEVPVPEPGPGQVLVKVAGAGLCHSDLHLMHAPFPAELLPFTLGHETSGWVEKLGSGVQGLETGEPVLVHGAWGCGHCRRCVADLEQFCENPAIPGIVGCGLGRDGGIAQYLCVPAPRLLCPLGDLDPRRAAPLDDAALTPYHVIKKHLHLATPDDSVVVIGVGGLGHMAIQILRALSSAQIVAVDRVQEKLVLARELGADHALIGDENAAEQIRELTGGRGAALVMDLVSLDTTLELAKQIVHPLSHIAVVGAAAGTTSYGFLQLPLECSISSTFWGSLGELREVVALAQRGRLKLETESFAIDDTALAYERLEKGDIRGRAIVLPNG